MSCKRKMILPDAKGHGIRDIDTLHYEDEWCPKAGCLVYCDQNAEIPATKTQPNGQHNAVSREAGSVLVDKRIAELEAAPKLLEEWWNEDPEMRRVEVLCGEHLRFHVRLHQVVMDERGEVEVARAEAGTFDAAVRAAIDAARKAEPRQAAPCSKCGKGFEPLYAVERYCLRCQCVDARKGE